MYQSKFAHDIEEMLTVLHNGGLQVKYLDAFLHDFDGFCMEEYPDQELLSELIAESWIHSTHSKCRSHMARRVCTMGHLGGYQQSLGKAAYIPGYRIKRPRPEEPRLFNDEQLAEFFEKADSGIKNTPVYPYNSILFPVLFRMSYSCGLRSSEACSLKVENVDLLQGKLSIFNSKGHKDRKLPMNEEIHALCCRFHKVYSKVVPDRKYFFQPSPSKEFYTSSMSAKVFRSIWERTSFYCAGSKTFTAHGLRHLFAVQNIRKCAESGEDFHNWIQYLCKYMGHKDIRDTMYYLHMTSQLFPVYRDKLKALEEGIAVAYVEE